MCTWPSVSVSMLLSVPAYIQVAKLPSSTNWGTQVNVKCACDAMWYLCLLSCLVYNFLYPISFSCLCSLHSCTQNTFLSFATHKLTWCKLSNSKAYTSVMRKLLIVVLLHEKTTDCCSAALAHTDYSIFSSFSSVFCWGASSVSSLICSVSSSSPG